MPGAIGIRHLLGPFLILFKFIVMKLLKVLSLLAFSVGSLGLSSCGCCTGEAPVPSLRPLPKLKEIVVEQEIAVEQEIVVDDAK